MVLSLTASFSAFGIEEQPALISPQFVGTPGIDDIPFCIDEDVITDAEHTVRLRYLETEDNVAAFSNPDGSATMYYFSNPIKYTDIYGNTVDIDNTVETFGELTDEYKFKTKSAPATTYLPATIGMGEDVKVEHNGFSVQIIPMSDRFAAGTTVASELKTGKDSAVLYSNVFGTGRSLKYTTLYNGVKEDIILNSYVANANSFNFIVKTNGLELAEIDGRYVFRDTLGIPMFEFSPIFVYDSAEVPNSTGGTYTVEELKPNDIYALTLTVDETWLSGATYPVTIDPTVTYNTDSGIEDAYSRATTYDLTGYETQLIIGEISNSTPLSRTYLRFPNLVNTLEMDSDIIESAKLHLTISSNTMETSPSTLSIHHITSGWVEYHWSGSYPYSSYDQSTAASKDYSISGTGSKELNITPFVRRFVDNEYVDANGLLIKLKNESLSNTTNESIVFYSSEATDTSKRPYIIVTLSSFSMPNGKQQGIRDDRFYWVSSDDQFLTKSDSRPDIIYSGQVRDYTLLKQRFLFTFDEEKGKYRISTENAPTTYLTVSGSYLVGSSLSSSNNQLWHIGCTNNGYYFIISAGDTSKSLALNNSSACLTTGTITSWTFEKCPTFYGQRVNVMNGFEYWDSTNLDNLFFPSYSNTRKFFTYTPNDATNINESPSANDNDIMTEGCVMCSIAMVLDNLGAKSSVSKYDIRNGSTGFMIPDPFTCTLANSLYFSNSPSTIIYDNIQARYECSFSTLPVKFDASVFTGFNCSFTTVSISGSNVQKAIALKNALSDHSEGILVRVGYNADNLRGRHTIVITKYIGPDNIPASIDDTTLHSYFIVYDPASRTQAQGSGCQWNLCKTYIGSSNSPSQNLSNAIYYQTIVMN